MQKRYLIVLLALLSKVALAQTGTINGRVSTADGKPADFITITVKGKGVSVKSNEKGDFTIARIKTGNYTLTASAVGISRTEKEVTVNAGKSTTINFILAENQEVLQEVGISSRKNKYVEPNPSSSLRLNEPLLQTPQNIQVVTGQNLKDQQVFSMSDGVIRNVSGAVRLEHWGDMYTNISMRGTQVQALRNGFNVVTSYWGPLTEDMSMVDHIEFVKGPSGFLLSNGEPSGLYNVVTKKPTGSNKGEAEFTVGSFDLQRASIDFDRRVTNDGKVLFRLNAAAQDKGSFRDFEKNNRYTFAPSLSYQITNSTKLTAEYAFQGARMTEVGSYYVFGNAYAITPRERTLTQPGLPDTRMKDHSVFLNLQQNLGESWKLTAQGGFFRYLQQGMSSWPSSVSADNKIIRNASIWDAKSTLKLAQLFVNGEAKTGGINHRILIGFDGGKKNYFADWGQYHDLDLPTQPFDIFNPDYSYPSNGYPNFDRSQSVEDRAALQGGIIEQKYLSSYIQDELGFFDNRVRLTLAGRYTYVSQGVAYTGPIAFDKAKKVTPRAGLSISIDKSTAVYGLFDQAFTPQTGFFRDGSTAKPITGSNIEAGIKKDWAGGKWNTSIAVYRILKRNQLTGDPTNTASENFSVELGKTKSEGIEFDLRGELARGLMLIANYAYTNAVVTEMTPGVTVYAVGDPIPGYAKQVGNAWLSYSLQNGALKGLGINAGMTYLGKRITEWEIAPLKLPNYTKFDAGLTYSKDNFRINANVFNLFDKYTYSGSYYSYLNAYYWQADAPRNFRVSVGYKF